MAGTFQRWRYIGHRHAARLLAARAKAWPSRSRVLISRDYAGWTLDVEAKALINICRRLDIPTASDAWAGYCRDQAIFCVDQFALMNPPLEWHGHRVALAYYHGAPDTGIPEFDRVFESLCKQHEKITRIQVSHSAMKAIVLNSGIDAGKVQVIPIGFHDEWFRPPTKAERRRMRQRLGFPESAKVVGSFQKDGVGWGEGLEPKLIKGPDVLIETMRRLHKAIPELHVLLTGPARGYVRQALSGAGIPYRHIMLRNYHQTAYMYHALDAYVVTSRQEGGPKAVLESMATGVPIVSTRVGQAVDLIAHGENGFLVDLEDVAGLAFWTERVLSDQTLRDHIKKRGLNTAAANSYRAQVPLWQIFMRKLMENN